MCVIGETIEKKDIRNSPTRIYALIIYVDVWKS